jgi:hypothetical protein
MNAPKFTVGQRVKVAAGQRSGDTGVVRGVTSDRVSVRFSNGVGEFSPNSITPVRSHRRRLNGYVTRASVAAIPAGVVLSVLRAEHDSDGQRLVFASRQFVTREEALEEIDLMNSVHDSLIWSATEADAEQVQEHVDKDGEVAESIRQIDGLNQLHITRGQSVTISRVGHAPVRGRIAATYSPKVNPGRAHVSVDGEVDLYAVSTVTLHNGKELK